MRHKGLDCLLLWGGGLLNVMNCKASVTLVDYVLVVNFVVFLVDFVTISNVLYASGTSRSVYDVLSI